MKIMAMARGDYQPNELPERTILQCPFRYGVKWMYRKIAFAFPLPVTSWPGATTLDPIWGLSSLDLVRIPKILGPSVRLKEAWHQGTSKVRAGVSRISLHIEKDIQEDLAMTTGKWRECPILRQLAYSITAHRPTFDPVSSVCLFLTDHAERNRPAEKTPSEE